MNETIILCQRCGSAALPSGICPACMASDLAEADSDAYFSPAADSSGAAPPFTIVSLLGRGGMGQVFRAHQSAPAREIAVKMLSPHLAASPDCRRRLLAEAAAMSELDHPAILPVYAAGELDGIPYFTMRLVEGGTLSAAKPRLTGRWREMATVMSTVADAVHHAHERGVLHRDLKPGNILFDAAGHPFVSDFGLAKLAFAESTAESLTHSAQLLGTPGYMAPEIAGGSMKAATTASDVYALGAILYELLSGQAPFEADSIQSLLRRIVEEEPLSLLSRNALIPRDLAAIAHKAMEKRPAARYATASAFGSDLLSWLEGRTVIARPASTLGKTLRWARRRPAVASLSALLFLGAGAGGVLLWKAWRAESRSRIAAENSRDSAEALAFFVSRELNSLLAPMGRPHIADRVDEAVNAYYLKAPGSNDPDFLFRKATHLRTSAQRDEVQSRSHEARNQLEEAIALASQALALRPEDPAIIEEYLLAQAEYGRVLGITGEEIRGADTAGQATHSAEIWLTAHPGDPRAAALAGECRIAWALVSQEAGDTAADAGHHDAAAAHFRRAAELAPDDNDRRFRFLETNLNAARKNHRSGETESVALRGFLDERISATGEPVWKARLSTFHSWTGKMAASPVEAEAAFREEMRINHDLVALDPANLDWQGNLAISQLNIAVKLMELQRPQDARQLAEAALPTLEKVLHQDPERERFADNVHIVLVTIGGIAGRMGEPAAALAHYAEAASRAEVRAWKNPARVQNWLHFDSALGSAHDLQFAAKNYKAASAEATRWRDLAARELSEGGPEGWGWIESGAQTRMALIALDQNRPQEALGPAAEASLTRLRLLQTGNALSHTLPKTASALIRQAKALATLGRIGEGFATFESALSALENIPDAKRHSGWRNNWVALVMTAVQPVQASPDKDLQQRGIALLRRALSILYPPGALLSSTDTKARDTLQRTIEKAPKPPLSQTAQ